MKKEMIYIEYNQEFFKLNRVGKNKIGSKIKWSGDQINYVINAYIHDHITIKELADMFDTSEETVRNLLHKNGVKTKSLSERSKEDRPRDSNFFEVIDTPEKAYWLGFLYADGGISIRKKSCSLRINLKKEDDEHLKKFLKAIKGEKFSIKYTTKHTKEKDYYGCYININDNKIVTDLIDKGCVPKKSLILQFPSEEQVPSFLVSHFLRGYFDGDGSIWYRIIHPETGTKYFHFNLLGTRDFLLKVQEILQLEHIKLDKRNNHYSLPLCGNKRIYEVLYFLYQDSKSDIELTRKRDKFDILSLQRMGGEPVNTGCA